jgi:purine nucleoside phosphorylase
VNYRANIYAAKSLGVTRIVAWTGPGAISRKHRPGDLVLPDDLLDFTRNRPSTFYEGKGIGFIRQHPVFCEPLREALLRALRSAASRRGAGRFAGFHRTPGAGGGSRSPSPRRRSTGDSG